MKRLHASLLTLRAVFRNPNLRRIELAWAGSITGQFAYSIALSVYAYRHGGAGTVGLLIVIRLLPAALLSPFAGVIGDRHRRERVMLVADLARVAAVGASAALVFLGGPTALVYALAVVTSAVATAFRPAQAALLPVVARSPEELTAANVSSSTIDSVGMFVGPALGGLVLAAFSVGAAFLFTAITFLWSALLVSRIRLAPGDAAATEPVHEAGGR